MQLQATSALHDVQGGRKTPSTSLRRLPRPLMAGTLSWPERLGGTELALLVQAPF